METVLYIEEFIPRLSQPVHEILHHGGLQQHVLALGLLGGGNTYYNNNNKSKSASQSVSQSAS